MLIATISSLERGTESADLGFVACMCMLPSHKEPDWCLECHAPQMAFLVGFENQGAKLMVLRFVRGLEVPAAKFGCPCDQAEHLFRAFLMRLNSMRATC
jgi:hypothetical protein